jgi:hypothetical protein
MFTSRRARLKLTTFDALLPGRAGGYFALSYARRLNRFQRGLPDMRKGWACAVTHNPIGGDEELALVGPLLGLLDKGRRRRRHRWPMRSAPAATHEGVLVGSTQPESFTSPALVLAEGRRPLVDGPSDAMLAPVSPTASVSGAVASGTATNRSPVRCARWRVGWRRDRQQYGPGDADRRQRGLRHWPS